MPGRLEWWRHPETLVCGIRGHVVPAADVRHVAPGLAALEAVLPDGRHLGRCLRCDAWITIPAARTGGALEALTAEQIPRRDRMLRDAIVLRLIAVERGVHAVAFALLAVGLLILRLDLPGLQASARHLVGQTPNSLAGPGQTASRDVIQQQLTRLLNLRKATLGVLTVTAGVYAVVEGTEAIGLWLEQRWAEYLTALATAGFLPFEIRELTRRVTVLRVGALAVNLAVLAYLIWKKHLFGIGTREPPPDRVADLDVLR